MKMIKYPLYVTIDTNIFDETKYDLAEGNTLSVLKNHVQKEKIKIVLSNIVINEVLKHAQDKACEIASMVNNLSKEIQKKYSDSIIKCVGMENLLKKVNRKDMACRAKAEVETFLSELDIEILDSSNVDVEKIFEDYFNFCPPFENSDKKRKEFPDAFIVAEIKERFKRGEDVAIVSKDNGFKRALGNSQNYHFFDSLGDLYNALSKQEQSYNKSLEYINKYSSAICQKINKFICENDCIDVVGMSYDKDGISEGYDYSETMLESVSNLACGIHTIDEISDEQVYATLVCKANFEVDCFYEDYDNAAWDSDSKTYFYVETRQIKEIHTARFAVKIKFDLQTEEFEISKFAITLGGDSRKERIEIEDDEVYDYEQEIIDMDRESVGLLAMDKYEDYLEESLTDSKMKEDFISKFEEINGLLSNFEDVCMVYDDVIERIKNESGEFVSKLAKKSKELENFPLEKENSEIDEDEISEVLVWLQDKYDEAAFFSEIKPLPDVIEFGKSITFMDANKRTYTLAIDDIQICPSEGEEEYIDIWLSNDSTLEIQRGHIKLTVGYMDYDEDGGVANGLSDDVEYYYEEIVDEMDYVIEGLKELFDKHNLISELLQNLQ